MVRTFHLPSSIMNLASDANMKLEHGETATSVFEWMRKRIDSIERQHEQQLKFNTVQGGRKDGRNISDDE